MTEKSERVRKTLKRANCPDTTRWVGICLSVDWNKVEKLISRPWSFPFFVSTGAQNLIPFFSPSSSPKPLLIPAPPIALYSSSLALAAYTCCCAHARTAARGWPSSPACVKGGNQHQAFRLRAPACCCLFCWVAAQVGFGKQERERKEGS